MWVVFLTLTYTDSYLIECDDQRLVVSTMYPSQTYSPHRSPLSALSSACPDFPGPSKGCCRKYYGFRMVDHPQRTLKTLPF